jgi:uncharacterized membrane protein
MKARLLHLWSDIRGSLWFVPAVMTLGATLLALAMLQLDAAGPAEWLSDVPWIESRSAAGARDLLRVVASSMITIAGLAFSIVVVALQLASSELGPRLLRNFMRDRGNQVVLGTFIATFVYCLLVMRTIRESDVDAPRLAVVVAMALTLASLSVLIYFVHHAAASMQAPNVIAAVSKELRFAIDRLYPETIGADATREAPRPPQLPDGEWAAVNAGESGYLQRVDDDGVLELTTRQDVTVRLCLRPGDFVAEGQPLAEVHPAGRLDPSLARGVRAVCILGSQRTAEQDLAFLVGLLVEIALRALSSSRHDVFTAVACIDHLSAALVRAAGRRIPSPYRSDGDGRVRVVAPGWTLGALIDQAFEEIRLISRPDTTVTLAMLVALQRVGRAVRDADTRAAVLRHVRLLVDDAEARVTDVEARRRIREAARAIG